MKQKDERKNANHELDKGVSRSWLFSRVGEGGQGCILIWSEDGGEGGEYSSSTKHINYSSSRV